MATDLQDQKIVIEDMTLTTSKFNTIKAMMSNIDILAQGHNAFTDAVEDEFNRLKELFDAAELADDVDIDKINETLLSVQELMSDEENGANIIAALGTVFTELNRRTETIVREETITSETGIAEVDLTAQGFSSVDEYSLLVTPYGRNPVSISVEKVDETKCNIVVEDRRFWEESTEDIRLKDCSADEDNVKVCLTIHRVPRPISLTLTEVDGDETTIGE
jgi:hypothetical protein